MGKKTSDPVADEDWQDLLRYRAGMPVNRPPVGQLPPQDWMQWPQTLTVIAALQAQGQSVRFVGGCVRDALCRKPIHDIDIATPDQPQQVIDLLTNAGIRVVPTGLDHGTVTAVIDAHHFEITTLRQDIETDGRHAKVAWTNSWMADAARRDFTINALSATADGAVYDYFDGLQHLAHGRVRFIGRPMDRITEDYLRILRFFRFHAHYGRGHPNRDALEACRLLAPNLTTLSAERVRDEVLKILTTPLAADVMVEMQGVRVLDALLPELRDIGRLRQVVFLETRGIRITGLEADPLRRLGALIVGGADAASRVAQFMRLSNAQSERLICMVETAAAPPPSAPAPLRRKILYQHGGAITADRLLLTWASLRAVDGRPSPELTTAYAEMIEQALSWQTPTFPLQGRDLAALGVPPGRQMGQLLRSVESWWADQGCQPLRDAVLAQAQAVLANSSADNQALETDPR